MNWSDGKGVLLRTTTGNNEIPNWAITTNFDEQCPLPTAFKSVKFNDVTHGYISGANGTILQTTNGIDWYRRPSPPTWNNYDNNDTRDTLTVGYNSFWLDPVNPNNIWASGDNFGTMVNTYNSGSTWDTVGSRPFDKEYKFPQDVTRQPFGTKYPNWGCDGVDMSHYYTGLGFGRVGYTTNGGNTWQTQSEAYKFPDTTYWVKDCSCWSSL